MVLMVVRLEQWVKYFHVVVRRRDRRRRTGRLGRLHLSAGASTGLGQE